MSKLDALVKCWDDQQWLALKHLPTDNIHQRKAYWKADRRLRRRIRGRAERVAHHLINLEWCARMEEAGDGYDETYAITL